MTAAQLLHNPRKSEREGEREREMVREGERRRIVCGVIEEDLEVLWQFPRSEAAGQGGAYQVRQKGSLCNLTH